MRIVSDLDGVVFSFNNSYARLLHEENPTKIPKDWQESDTVPSCWDWDRALGYTSEELSRVWGRINKKDSTFWSKLDPLPGAVEFIKQLNKLSAKNHEVSFLTHRSGYGAKRQSEIALYNLGMNYPTVNIVKEANDKIPFLRLTGAEWFIDDKRETLNECVSSATTQGLALFLLNKPYNQTGRLGGYTVVDTLQEALEKAGL